MRSEVELAALLAAWRADIDSVPFPVLLTVEAALAVLAVAKGESQGLTGCEAGVDPP